MEQGWCNPFEAPATLSPYQTTEYQPIIHYYPQSDQQIGMGPGVEIQGQQQQSTTFPFAMPLPSPSRKKHDSNQRTKSTTLPRIYARFATQGLPSDAADWDVPHVCTFLHNMGLAQHVLAFAENVVTGPELLALASRDLGELGVTNSGERELILRAIRKLQQTSKRRKDRHDYCWVASISFLLTDHMKYCTTYRPGETTFQGGFTPTECCVHLTAGSRFRLKSCSPTPSPSSPPSPSPTHNSIHFQQPNSHSTIPSPHSLSYPHSQSHIQSHSLSYPHSQLHTVLSPHSHIPSTQLQLQLQMQLQNHHNGVQLSSSSPLQTTQPIQTPLQMDMHNPNAHSPHPQIAQSLNSNTLSLHEQPPFFPPFSGQHSAISSSPSSSSSSSPSSSSFNQSRLDNLGEYNSNHFSQGDDMTLSHFTSSNNNSNNNNNGNINDNNNMSEQQYLSKHNNNNGQSSFGQITTTTATTENNGHRFKYVQHAVRPPSLLADSVPHMQQAQLHNFSSHLPHHQQQQQHQQHQHALQQQSQQYPNMECPPSMPVLMVVNEETGMVVGSMPPALSRFLSPLCAHNLLYVSASFPIALHPLGGFPTLKLKLELDVPALDATVTALSLKLMENNVIEQLGLREHLLTLGRVLENPTSHWNPDTDPSMLYSYGPSLAFMKRRESQCSPMLGRAIAILNTLRI